MLSKCVKMKDAESKQNGQIQHEEKSMNGGKKVAEKIPSLFPKHRSDYCCLHKQTNELIIRFVQSVLRFGDNGLRSCLLFSLLMMVRSEKEKQLSLFGDDKQKVIEERIECCVLSLIIFLFRRFNYRSQYCRLFSWDR